MRLRGVLALTLAAMFAGGFLAFADRAARYEKAALDAADGVVVLTGGVERIAAGAQLVAEKRGRRLLISGVNEKATRDDMLTRNPQLRTLDPCCLDLGYRAQNTIGNALEARDWAQRNNYRSLALVTAASHMPRALAEFGHAMPGLRMIPHAAGGDRLDKAPWWRDLTLLRILGYEYLKYVAALSRMALEPEPGRWFPGALRETDGHAHAARR